uniref:RING-type domain-containing protein n=1 Tax=Mola mola TaxID=94237 RepID=A0A3Q3WXV5_MOLML
MSGRSAGYFFCSTQKFGLTLCPVCMGDPQDPLRLPCEHIYCVGCIRQWLGPGQMYCPLCITWNIYVHVNVATEIIYPCKYY